MVARITYGKNIVGVLEYNKLKVDKETAGVLCCHKLPVMPLDGKIDFHKLVEAFAPHLSDPRSRLSDPVFHASLNPHPEDRLSDARLIEIAHEYMERMGYGAQPFVVFKHEDIARSHLHIVSICIGPDGKTIDRYNDRKRSQEITRELERQYGLHSSQGERPVFEKLRRVDYRAGNVRAQVASVVRSMTDRYRFASAGELNTLLRPLMSGSKSVAEKRGAAPTKVSFTERSMPPGNVSATRSLPAVSGGMSGTTPCKDSTPQRRAGFGKTGSGWSRPKKPSGRRCDNAERRKSSLKQCGRREFPSCSIAAERTTGGFSASRSSITTTGWL